VVKLFFKSLLECKNFKILKFRRVKTEVLLYMVYGGIHLWYPLFTWVAPLSSIQATRK
jgi:hypothetical protein